MAHRYVAAAYVAHTAKKRGSRPLVARCLAMVAQQVASSICTVITKHMEAYRWRRARQGLLELQSQLPLGQRAGHRFAQVAAPAAEDPGSAMRLQTVR